MQRILPARQHWPLHGVASARRIEAAALVLAEAGGQPPQLLMRRAGAAVARLALAVAPHAQQVWIAAGPGNNGGDGFEAALQLHRQGRSVVVSLAGDQARLPRDAAATLLRAQTAGVVVQAVDSAAPHPPMLGPGDLAIDALLGLGASRAPSGAIAQLIDTLNALPCPVLAVDLPSGLDAERGHLLGSAAVRARHSLALLNLKPGLFTGVGRDHAGTVWLDTLGVATDSDPPDAWLAGPSAAGRWSRSGAHATHKGSYGDVLVVGGAPGMGGAVVLAARAAHAAGAGRVWLAPLDPAAPRFDPLRPELMWRSGLDRFDDTHLGALSVVCGCGGGSAVAAALPRLMALAPRLVLDADALNVLARAPALQTSLRDRAGRGLHTVLTPHPLEAARLLGINLAELQADRMHAAQALVDRHACVVVLKGSGSVVAAPGRLPHLNASGNAALATAGSGDVLAGWLAGCWSASGIDPEATDPAARAHAAALASVWRHGAAAEACGLPLLRAADLIEQMARPLPC